MPWGGNGVFSRVYSWVADKAAGLDISSTRMDTDTDDIATNGFGNCLTRDGQGQPTANLPMAGFRHTGAANAVNRTDYAAFGQVQDGLSNWTIAGGTSDAITATYSPALQAINDGQLCFVRAGAANATTAPTFAPNGLTPEVITKSGGAALGIGDIPGNFAESILRYNLANTRWELLNPSNVSLNNGILSTGNVVLTVGSAPPGWLLCDDGTFGSATSGSSNSNSAANQALFTMMFNNISDTWCPILTSTGAGTTRAGQGSAAAAWAANCRMSLPKMLGRVLGVAGSGSGLTARAIAQNLGEETHLLVAGEIPTITGTASVAPTGGNLIPLNTAVGNAVVNSGSATDVAASANAWTSTASLAGTMASTNTGGGAHNNMQPSTFLNAIIKQ